MQWFNHFKVIYDTKKITHGTLKMVDNHLLILCSHHILKHGGNHYLYFDYEEKIGDTTRSTLMIVLGKKGIIIS